MFSAACRIKMKITGDECHLLFSKEAMIVTKVDQRLVIESKAAETISHCKALKTSEHSILNFRVFKYVFKIFLAKCLQRVEVMHYVSSTDSKRLMLLVSKTF